MHIKRHILQLALCGAVLVVIFVVVVIACGGEYVLVVLYMKVMVVYMCGTRSGGITVCKIFA